VQDIRSPNARFTTASEQRGACALAASRTLRDAEGVATIRALERLLLSLMHRACSVAGPSRLSAVRIRALALAEEQKLVCWQRARDRQAAQLNLASAMA